MYIYLHCLHTCAHGCMNFSTCVYITAFVCACLCLCPYNHMCISHVYMCKRHLIFCLKCRGNKGVPCLGPDYISCINTHLSLCSYSHPTVPQGPLSPALQPHSPNVLRIPGSQWPLCKTNSSHSWASPHILSLVLDAVSSVCDLLESAFSSNSRLSFISPMEPLLICPSPCL